LDLVWKGRNSGCIIEYGKGNKKTGFLFIAKTIYQVLGRSSEKYGKIFSSSIGFI